MEIIDNRALKLRVRKPDRITQVIPKSKVISEADGIYEVLVHWDLEEVHVLRNLGIKNVPSPIIGKYNWPGLYKPFEHQLQTAAFLTMHRRAYCLNEMGTGKSCSALWAADYLMSKGLVQRVLVVCPLSIMDSAWRADAFKSVMHRTVDIAYGTKDKRKKVIASDADIVIINYDGIEVVCEDIARGGFNLIIIDEYNHYKNAQSKRWKIMNGLIKHDTWLWGMTGSPASQSPLDAYGLAKLMNPASVPKFYGSFRDSVMIKLTQFKYIPKPGAEDEVFKILQPAIRFTKEECLDLPEMLYATREVPLTAQQAKYYKKLKEQMMIEAAGEEITTVNAAVNLNKLLQIACISYNTPVLTNNGWVPIQDVTKDHLVWDGVEWVQQQGAIYRGTKPVVNCWGVFMTEDHKVLTDTGWIEALEINNVKSGKKFNRAKVWIPSSYSKKRNIHGQIQKGQMALPMRLREPSYPRESIFEIETQGNTSKLWMPSWKRNTPHGKAPCLYKLPQHDWALYESERQGLSQLWGKRYTRLRKMAARISILLGRHVRFIRQRFNIRQNRREWPILEGKLPVGYAERTSEQYTGKYNVRYPMRKNDSCSSCRYVQYKTNNAVQKIKGRLASTSSAYNPTKQTQKTFDILNCGPRNRFVVLGSNGPLIVHNCGSVYSDNKEVIEFDASNRLNALEEIIDESSHKVLVFANFRHGIEMIQNRLAASGYTVDVIHGGIPAGARTNIFQKFQTEPNPRVLVIQPQSASHGVTLTAANTIVWFGPVTSYETYVQANARVHRAGQKNSCMVIHLTGCPVEDKLYRALEQREKLQDSILSLYEEVMNG